jgi:SAM-dependent methyltransferase
MEDSLSSKLDSRPATHQSYDPAYYAPLLAIEDQHFWFRARNRVISTLVNQITVGLPSGYRALEVGCGTGNVLRVLEQVCSGGLVVGMDLFAEGLQYARQRTDCALVQGDMSTPPFTARFDLIGLFDVLEHLPDDMQVLRDLHTLLASGGVLLLTVPAHPSLWSYFDEASHHCRRYELAELENRLVDAGYRVEYMTQYMASIFPLVWLGRRLTGLLGGRPGRNSNQSCALATNELRITPVINGMLTFLLTQEARLIARRRQLPIGTSLLALARKEPISVG